MICGPTGAGKSALALPLAESAGAAILSADSRQVYRGFDIGTAKPTAAERARVAHFGIDVAEPTDRYSAAAWAEEAGRAADMLAGPPPLVVGGTGFYLRALFAPLFAEPRLDPGRRAAVQAELEPLPTAELRRRVELADPPRAHLGRAQLLRALEVAALTGRRLSAWHAEAARPARFRPRYCVVDPGAALAARIEARADAMLGGGWPEEVAALDGTVPDDAPAWNAAGYEAIRAMVRGEIGRAAARERVIVETRQYAKRQRTWFRHQLGDAPVARIDPTAPGVDRALAAWWKEGTTS
ncbi:MAG TPA: tRNA (adenosine(37)-N6)-dimethylallyltransferase MiaA [Gemmatimonadaceae bacterium]|nr:tRNA (adenosine(37)-N6)-dimethylallyltransferase MiaA [Gemmatimonadaceae bacterium]